eukprot:4632121-Pleurochrysis_carterae.AAC.1
MEYSSLLSAAHIPPDNHDFSVPWRCCHCGIDVFASRAEFEAAVAELAALKARCLADDEDREAAAAFDKRMADHSRGHLDQLLFVAP